MLRSSQAVVRTSSGGFLLSRWYSINGIYSKPSSITSRVRSSEWKGQRHRDWLMYGYDSPESFARSFRIRHGLSPREAATSCARLTMYPRLSFQISIQEAMNMKYRIDVSPVRYLTNRQ